MWVPLFRGSQAFEEERFVFKPIFLVQTAVKFRENGFGVVVFQQFDGGAAK